MSNSSLMGKKSGGSAWAAVSRIGYDPFVIRLHCAGLMLSLPLVGSGIGLLAAREERSARPSGGEFICMQFVKYIYSYIRFTIF